MQLLEKLTNKAIEWVDAAIAFFGLYTTKYSKYLVYGLLIFLAAKIFKVKINLGK